MAITKENDIIQVISIGKYLIRVVTDMIIKEDGAIISAEKSKRDIRPSDDWSSEPAQVKKMCDALFTAAIIKEYKDGTGVNL